MTTSPTIHVLSVLAVSCSKEADFDQLIERKGVFFSPYPPPDMSIGKKIRGLGLINRSPIKFDPKCVMS